MADSAAAAAKPKGKKKPQAAARRTSFSSSSSSSSEDSSDDERAVKRKRSPAPSSSAVKRTKQTSTPEFESISVAEFPLLLSSKRATNNSTFTALSFPQVSTTPHIPLDHAPRRPTRPLSTFHRIGDAIFYGDETFAELNNSSLLRNELGTKFGLRFVCSALPGRTSFWDNKQAATKMGAEFCTARDFNGIYHLGPLFASHTPKFLVVCLGGNDFKSNIRNEAAARLGATVQVDEHTIAQCVVALVIKARNEWMKGHCHDGPLRTLIVTPAVISNVDLENGVDEEAMRMSSQFATVLTLFATKYDIPVLEYKQDGGGALHEQVWSAMQKHMRPPF